MVALDPRHLGRARNQIIHERRRQELPVRVVDDALEQHVADALDDAATHLPFDDRRIDHLATILGAEIAQYANLAGRNIDLDPTAVRSLRPSSIGNAEVVT